MRFFAMGIVFFCLYPVMAKQNSFVSAWSQMQTAKFQPYNSSENIQTRMNSGQVKIILFWASWCEFCKDEFAQLGKLQNKYPANQLNIVAINVDEKFEAGKEIAEKSPTKFLFLHDKNLEFKKLIGVPKLPMTLIYSADGKFEAAYTGFSGERFGYMKKRINSLLNNEQEE